MLITNCTKAGSLTANLGLSGPTSFRSGSIITTPSSPLEAPYGRAGADFFPLKKFFDYTLMSPENAKHERRSAGVPWLAGVDLFPQR